uniref:Uncharacterized protein n=1 Tax=Magallana gigas TaxID=29159 RepID=K1QPR2_MAGGI
MVAVLSISLPRDKLFDLQKMRYRGYLLAILLTYCVWLFPRNVGPVAEHIDHFFACLAAILRLPAFFLLEKWLQSSEGEVWSQKHVAVTVLFGATLLICLPKDQLFELFEIIIGFILLTREKIS